MGGGFAISDAVVEVSKTLVSNRVRLMDKNQNKSKRDDVIPDLLILPLSYREFSYDAPVILFI